MSGLNLYHQSLTWAKNLVSLHTSWPFHPLADLLRPLGAPHSLGASLYFAPTHTSVLISMPNPCCSDQLNTLTQEIPPPNLLRSLPEPSLSTANLLTHSLNPLPSSKTQPTNVKTPVLNQLSTVKDITSAWQTRYTNALFVPLPDVLLLVKTDITHTFNTGTHHRWCAADNMDSKEVSA